MTNEEKAKYLNNLLMTLQKFRSNLELDFIQNDKVKSRVAKDLLPWVISEKCPIPALLKSLEIYEQSNMIDPMFFYNMMFMVHRLQPELIGVAILLGYPEFPEPKVSMIVEENNGQDGRVPI